MTPTNNALPELRPLLTRLYQHSADCYKAAQESNDVVIGVGQLLAISRDIDEVLRELCHASAGREAVAWQCRAASGDADLGTWLWGKLMDFCQKRRMPPAEYNDLFKIVDELRALSRGVPEGNQAAVDSVIRQYCRTCGGCGEIGGHSGQTPESYEEWSAPCPDCSPAAIAAQRKEG